MSVGYGKVRSLLLGYIIVVAMLGFEMQRHAAQRGGAWGICGIKMTRGTMQNYVIMFRMAPPANDEGDGTRKCL